MKKFFRLALVLALAGSALVYTGCTKDYSEEIDNLNSKVDTQNKELTDAINEAKGLAAAAATKTDLQNYAKLSDLNSAIEALEGGYDGSLEDLAGEISDLRKAIEAFEDEGGLYDQVADALTAIEALEALFNQIQSVVLVPTDIKADAAIVFDPYDFGGEFGHGAELYAAKVLYQVFPAKFAAEVGTKYTPEALVVPVRKGVDVDFTLETNVIKADPTTGFVELSYIIIPDHESLFRQPNLDKGYAVSLKLTDEASHTEIASEYWLVEHEHRDVIDLIETAVIAKNGKVLHPHSNTFRNIQLLYDDLEAEEEFFEGGEIAFEDYYGNLYTKAEVEAMFGGRYSIVDETWVDFPPYEEPLAFKPFAINGEAVALGDYRDLFDADPVTVGIACKTSEEAAEWIGAKTRALKYIGFADAAATDTAWFDAGMYEEDEYCFAYNYAEIVPSYASAITFSDTLKVYWNYETANPVYAENYYLAFDNSLLADVAAFTNADGTDFCEIRQFCGFLSQADFDYLYDKGNGEISAFIGTDGTPNHRFDEETRHYGMYMNFKSKSSVDVGVWAKDPGYWPRTDRTFYAVWAFLPEVDNYLLVVPVKVYTKPDLGKTFEITDTIAKDVTSYTVENFIDSVYTKALEDALIRGHLGEWYYYLPSVNEPTDYSARDLALLVYNGVYAGEYSFIDAKTTVNGAPLTESKYAEWLYDSYGYVEDFKISWDRANKYEDLYKFDIHFDVFGITYKLKLSLKVEDAPAYKFAFIESERITVSESGDTATVYAPLQENGKPETVYLNQAVRLVRPTGTTIGDEDDLKVKVTPTRDSKYSWSNDPLGLKNLTIGETKSGISVQKTGWVGDTLKSWIASADKDLVVSWPDQVNKKCFATDAYFQFVLLCDGKGIDTVTVKVASDDPFKGEGAKFEGGHIVIDASAVAGDDIIMDQITIFDSLTVKSIITDKNYLPEQCNAEGRKIKVLPVTVNNKSYGELTFLKPENSYVSGSSPEQNYYENGYLYHGTSNGLGVTVYCAEAKEWKSQFGALIDNPTNWQIYFEKGQITLKKGSSLTEDINITIPVYMKYIYSSELLKSTVTVTFKK